MHNLKKNNPSAKLLIFSKSHNLAGYWARRIDESNRMVYTVENNTLKITRLRYHYGVSSSIFILRHFARIFLRRIISNSE